MMTSLFSMFDPSTSLFNFSWLAVLFPLAITYKTTANLTTINSFKLSVFSLPIFKDLKSTINNLSSGELLLSFIILIFILAMNLLSIYPYTFTSTGQLSLVLPISLIFWTGVNFVGWTSKFKSSMIHLVPLGTPSPLMNFMVLVELISNIIRPITLSVRLIANMVAGHLLMSLLGGLTESSICVGAFSFFPMLMLTVLELSVCFIQAYVFMTLISLYIKEYM